MGTTTDLQADLRNIGVALGLAVGVVFDPSADASERWVASIGLDAMGAGDTPGQALGVALGEVWQQLGYQVGIARTTDHGPVWIA